MNPVGYQLPSADVEWQDNTPFSRDFGDIYWSRDTGVAEKTHVFLAPSNLTERWRQLTRNSHFTIVELGFGLGLNFLLTMQMWLKGNHSGQLHFVSFENRPVSIEQLEPLARLLPRQIVQPLLDRYPAAIPGIHSLRFPGNIRLTLIFDDVLHGLRGLSTSIDAWYLDGFSPSLNPEPWQQQVLGQVARLSKPGCTLATYTVAGHVRRGIAAIGFETNKVPGFGSKREMLTACKPGFWRPSTWSKQRTAIVGAGIAGAFLQEALVRRGIEFQQYGDSTINRLSQLAVYPSLALRGERRYRFSLIAHQFAISDNPCFHQSGMAIRIYNDTDRERWYRIAEQLPRHLIMATDHQVVFPASGWLDVGRLEQIPHVQNKVHDVQRIHDGWSLLDDRGKEIDQAEVVILATGASTLPIASALPIDVIPGLSLKVRTQADKLVTSYRHGTLFPTVDGVSTLSGLYDRSMTAVGQRDTDKLMSELPDEPELITAEIGNRAVTPDKLPIAGAMPDWNSPRFGRQEGLFVLLGLGSHGATTARLCAEHIVSMINGEPPAIERASSEALAPNRFVLRGRTRE